MFTNVATALETIKQERLNLFRCNLTGAPYAVIEDDEIVMTLESDLREDISRDADALVDLWTRRLHAYAGMSAPVLRSVHKSSLVPFLSRAANGNARIMTYMMTRLFFPHIGAAKPDSDKIIGRSEFSREMFDFLVKLDPELLTEMSQRLVAIDAYCSMPHWHTLWLFESTMSKYGIHSASKVVKQAFNEPDSLVGNILGIHEVSLFMFNLMLRLTERDGVAGKSGSRLAQEILILNPGLVPVENVPHFQKEIKPAQLERIQDTRAFNQRVELRIAHSATHGRSVLPDGRVMVGDQLIERCESVNASAELLASFRAAAEKKKADRIRKQLAEAKGEKPAPSATRKAKPRTAIEEKMADAIAKLGLNFTMKP